MLTTYSMIPFNLIQYYYATNPQDTLLKKLQAVNENLLQRLDTLEQTNQKLLSAANNIS